MPAHDGNAPGAPILIASKGVIYDASGRFMWIGVRTVAEVQSGITEYFGRMKLAAWAKANGLTYQAAWRMWRNGKLPVPAEQLPTGTVIVHPPQTPAVDSVAIYTRVSSADQKPDLERQVGRLAEFASRER